LTKTDEFVMLAASTGRNAGGCMEELFPDAERHAYLITKYHIPNMGDLSIVGSQLSSVLDRLDTHHSLSAEDKQYLRDKGLFDLHTFVKGWEETGKPDFRLLEGSFLQMRWHELQAKYGLGYVAPDAFPRLRKIVYQIHRGERLQEADAVWLATQNYFSPDLKENYHLIEAKFYEKRFQTEKNPWDAVNASSDFRKAGLPERAFRMTASLDVDQQRDFHLSSAICTTHGGALRDQKQPVPAMEWAKKAHHFDPNSFHPCTLLGALYYDQGNFSQGQKWFQKAVERGAEPRAIDAELRSIFSRASDKEREALRSHLLQVDSARYAWVNRSHRARKQ
jgi:hypothetical protein